MICLKKSEKSSVSNFSTKVSDAFVAARAEGDDSGTTATAALVESLGGRRTLHVACAGDSRGVLCRGGVAVPITTDHRPEQEAEYARILAAGGEIDEEFGGGGIVSPAGDQYLLRSGLKS